MLLETHHLSSCLFLQYGLLSEGGDELYSLLACCGLWLDPPSRDWGRVSLPPCHLGLVPPYLQHPPAPPGKHVHWVVGIKTVKHYVSSVCIT